MARPGAWPPRQSAERGCVPWNQQLQGQTQSQRRLGPRQSALPPGTPSSPCVRVHPEQTPGVGAELQVGGPPGPHVPSNCRAATRCPTTAAVKGACKDAKALRTSIRERSTKIRMESPATLMPLAGSGMFPRWSSTAVAPPADVWLAYSVACTRVNSSQYILRIQSSPVPFV